MRVVVDDLDRLVGLGRGGQVEVLGGESYIGILARHGLEEISVDGRSTPPLQDELGMALSGASGAKLVEVRLDPDLGLLRVARVVTAIDGGRIPQREDVTSQIVGGTVAGISQALFEETVTDIVTGRRLRDLPFALDRLML
ncbi:molybdopterin cofactor-binding domain-containing protein [Streptomyces sp. NPDC002640]